jgi:uncharacterized membrane protein YbhN (UPF0104 family)
MTGRRWSWALGAAVLAVVVAWVGTDPFVTGVRSLDVATLAVGFALGVVVTAASAWRWWLVARAIGLALPVGRAVAGCYRSQLLNTVLPGGVVGDVLRGLDAGRAAGDPARGLRAVAWERAAGQLVQGAVVVAALTLLPSPFRSTLPVVVAGVVVAGVVVVGATVVALGRAPGLRDDLGAMRRERVWPGVLLASVVVVAGLATTYVVAARAVGVTAPVVTLLPVALLVLVAAAVPANLAGWGPREGVAAWAFAAAGLGAAQGVATTVAFGVVVLVAALPGAVVLGVEAVLRAVRPTAAPAVEERAHG